MHVLLVGSGGREHALAWKIAKSPLLSRLTCVPGSDAMGHLGTRADVPFPEMPDYAVANGVDLVVVGPEAPLADGLADRLAEAGVPCFGPGAAGARIEASKNFVKELCAASDIPTGRAEAFTDPDSAIAALDRFGPMFVLKADGLAAGKGVVLTEDRAEAERTIRDMMTGKFGDAGRTVLIEEYLSGTELSVFALCDGETVTMFGAAQDHKRAFENDAGPNTGGMGGFSPSPAETPELMETVRRQIVEPTVAELRRRGITYRGALFAGLMVTAEGPKLIEYNCRFGDPECQILMRRLRSDVLPLLWGAATGRLAGLGVDWTDDAVANVVMAAKGYPDAYEKGTAIRGLDRAAEAPEVVVFEAGTRHDGGHVLAAGGRVLNVTAAGPDLGTALDRAYGAVDLIDWPEGFHRGDIGAAHRA